jgi:hypothetical protein
MGDQKSGSQQTMQTSNSTSTSGPNPYIAPQLQNLVNGATSWMDANQTAPGYFPGGTYAGQSPAALSARDAAWQWGTSSLNGLDDAFRPATNYLSDAASGKYLDPANNPGLKGYLDAMFRPQAEQFRDIISPSLDSKFAGSGRTAGGAHFDTSMRGYQDLARAQSDATAKVYESERGLQQGAAQALPGVLSGKTGLAQGWLQMLNRVGAGDDANNQRILDAQNQKYSYDTTGQLDWYARLSQLLQGMYPGGQTQGSSTSMGTGSGSPGGGGIGSFLGPGLSLAGMALPFLPGFGASDERLKKNIRPVGETYTGHKLYSYEFLGSDKPEIGVMAQEVEKTDPDAVVMHPAGFRMVNYGHVTTIPKGGLL